MARSATSSACCATNACPSGARRRPREPGPPRPPRRRSEHRPPATGPRGSRRRRPVLADLGIAITGAASASGQAVRALLAQRKVPAERLRMLEHASDEAIISEYAGQATLIGTLEPAALADRDLVFLCGNEEESRRCLLW